MSHDQDATSAQTPEDFQEYSDARFGFKVQMPTRFEIIPTTVDPLSRMIRGLDNLPEEEQRKVQQQLPVGFWDPELIGELESGKYQPLRLIEYDALRDSTGTISEDRARGMREEVVDFMPKTLESARMPGYKYLGTSETKLGELQALAFDYRWDGPRPKMYGGDRVRIVWAVGDAVMFHVYYHCSTKEWDRWLPEFETILASFTLMKPEEMEQEAARSAAAMAAFSAARAGGDSEEAAMAAAQAAYEAATAGETGASRPTEVQPAEAGASEPADEPLDMATAIAEAKEALSEGPAAGAEPEAESEAEPDDL
jgi:hypothetical protein